MKSGRRATQVAFARSRRAQAAQATVEYVLMLGMSAVIGLAFLSVFTPLLQQGIVIMGAALEQNLVTAGYQESGCKDGNASMWKNRC